MNTPDPAASTWPLDLNDLLVQHERYLESDECMACDLSLLAASECRIPELVAAYRALAAQLAGEQARAERLTKWAETERDECLNRNADRYWQMERVVHEVHAALAQGQGQQEGEAEE